jgi:hypothetical protein
VAIRQNVGGSPQVLQKVTLGHHTVTRAVATHAPSARVYGVPLPRHHRALLPTTAPNPGTALPASGKSVLPGANDATVLHVLPLNR